MDMNKFMREVRPNLRPTGVDTCPICGKEKQMINKLLNSKTLPRCIPCWQNWDGVNYEQPPAPVKKVMIEQETLTGLETRLSELEGRVGELERQLHNTSRGKSR